MSDAVQQIKDKLSIEEVIAPYVELHKAGKNLKGKSPFTAEKTPSFYVSPDRGMYYCFSSNQGGDMFTFIQAMEGVDFKGALKILADKAGVELVPEDPRKRTERETKYAILEEATKFYESQLAEAGAAEATAYLKKRGVSDKTIQLWRIGFAPDAWRAVKEELEKKKHLESMLRSVGLVKGEATKEPYDVFRNRIMFPIFDPSGRVVAYSGRTLSADVETPKYVNSPETELFNKSAILYGYDKAKQGIRKFDFSLIVEGQFDVVLAHQAGYNNAVAVSGTALTPSHISLLSRLSNRVVLALDADRAGLAAMKKAATIMLPRGMDVKIARMPEGKDPADIILADKEEFKKIIGHSVHVIEHFLNVLIATSRDARALGIAISEELLPQVVLLPNAIEHDYFVGLIAERTEIGKDALRQELTRIKEAVKHRSEEAEAVHSFPPVSSFVPESAVRPDKLGEHKALFFMLPDLVEGVDEKKLAVVYAELTGSDFFTDKENIALSDEISINENYKKQNPNLSKKEQHARALHVVRDMYRSHLDGQILDTKNAAGNSSETAQHVFELRKKKEAASELELDIFV